MQHLIFITLTMIFPLNISFIIYRSPTGSPVRVRWSYCPTLHTFSLSFMHACNSLHTFYTLNIQFKSVYTHLNHSFIKIIIHASLNYHSRYLPTISCGSYSSYLFRSIVFVHVTLSILSIL